MSEQERREALYYLGESDAARIHDGEVLGLVVEPGVLITGYRVVRHDVRTGPWGLKQWDRDELYVVLACESASCRVLLRRDGLELRRMADVTFGDPYAVSASDGSTFVGLSKDGERLVQRASPYSLSIRLGTPSVPGGGFRVGSYHVVGVDDD